MTQEIQDKYTVVIGLEVHAQLATESKIYNSDSTAYGKEPNTNVSTITLGHPGTLPVLNRKVVEYAIKMGLACDCEITREMVFDRKNYFYPDLPKGYQITQDRTPICVGGGVRINPVSGTERVIPLNRIHIEEDAGKSIHLPNEKDTLVDFNRSGVPLIEIVTEPELRAPEEAHALLMEIRKLVRYLEICDGNMEEGSLRCDANVSIMLNGAKEYGNKVEVKNMNSMRNVQRAIEFEIDRQIQIVEEGGEIVSETRNFDAATGLTTGMRTKEALNDYRYFPDPDLSPVHVSDAWLNEIKESMPALPRALYLKFMSTYGLPPYDALLLTENKETAHYFEEACSKTSNFKAVSNWLMGPIKSYLNEHNSTLQEFNLSTTKLIDLIKLVDENKLSFSIASQRLFPKLLVSDKDAETLAEELNLLHNTDEGSLIELIDEVIAKFPDKVKAYQKGNKGLLGMFMGQLMKESGGKVDPKKANELLRNKLG